MNNFEWSVDKVHWNDIILGEEFGDGECVFVRSKNGSPIELENGTATSEIVLMGDDVLAPH